MQSTLITEGDVKEQLSIDYISAIGHICRMNVERGNQPDRDSIDAAIFGRYQSPGIVLSRPRLELQLKATSQKEIVNTIKQGEHIFPFQISRKNYDDLRITDITTPRLLSLAQIHKPKYRRDEHHHLSGRRMEGRRWPGQAGP